MIHPDHLASDSLATLECGVVVVDSANHLLLANPAAHRMHAVTVDRLASRLAALADQARVTQTPATTECELGASAETAIAVRATATPLPASSAVGGDIRDISGTVAVQLLDITEVHRIAAVRKDFVANVSHELKTPVGALAVLAEAILAATDDPTAVRRFAERIVHESDRLTRLVTELIELSRLQGAEPTPPPVPVDVDEILGAVLERTRLAAESAEISVVHRGQADLWVSGTKQQLVTAVVNLVENALAYSPPRTTVRLDVQRDGEWVRITVHDEGIGIADSDLTRIFERFYRVDQARSRATGGTGLGLAIVKHVVAGHRGTIEVTSKVGVGSSFVVTLPAADRGSP